MSDKIESVNDFLHTLFPDAGYDSEPLDPQGITRACGGVMLAAILFWVMVVIVVALAVTR